MTDVRRPAGYLCVARSCDPAAAVRRQTMLLAAAQRGWPAPAIYAEAGEDQQAGGYGPALRRLEAAITAGRHDALLLTAPGTLGDAEPLMHLLARCTALGVPVSFVMTTGAGASGAS